MLNPKSNPIVVLLVGKIDYGKSTFASLLSDHLWITYKKKTRIISYAYDVKQLARKKGWNGEKDHNGRILLQFIGTEYGREMIPRDVWVEEAVKKIDSSKDFIIIPDVRFFNEITFMNSLYRTTTVRLIRLDKNGEVYKVPLPKHIKNHESEQNLNDYETTYVFKAKNVEQFNQQAEEFASELVKKPTFLNSQKI